MKPRFLALTLACGLAAVGCADKSGSAAADSTLRTDSAGGLVVAPSEPYQPNELEASTALVVTLVGDSVGAPKAPVACTTSGEPSSQTLFWVDGIRAGKPLPNERRYQLVNGPCGLEPRIQATVVGGAVNVFSEAGAHKLVFVRAGTTDTLQTMPFTLPGSVVATDRLTHIAGIVEVKCSMHANEKAHIAVFDHPYFGVAASGDKVTLDAIPAGDYRVMTWHDGLPAPVAVPAKVGASGQTELVVR
jgi:hypothetical protein